MGPTTRAIARTALALLLLSLSACGSGSNETPGDAGQRLDLELFLGHYADCLTHHNDRVIREQMVAAGTRGDNRRAAQLAPRASETALAMQVCTRTAGGAVGDPEPYRSKIARPWADIAVGYELAGRGFSSGEPEQSRLLDRSQRLQRKAATELGAAVAMAERQYMKLGGKLAVVQRVAAAL